MDAVQRTVFYHLITWFALVQMKQFLLIAKQFAQVCFLYYYKKLLYYKIYFGLFYMISTYPCMIIVVCFAESLFFKFGFERINKHIPIYVIMLLAMLVCSLLISKLLCANKKYAHFNLKTSL